jgi:hypothetical protein
MKRWRAESTLGEGSWTQEAEIWLVKIYDDIAQDKPAAAFNVEALYGIDGLTGQFLVSLVIPH